jgi:3-dehydroquinate dehydratase / shikimate dehydrogenase
LIVAVVARRSADATRAALRALAAEPGFSAGPPIAEIRLDAAARPTPEVFRDAPVPTIATCRRPRDGGLFRGAEADRLELLRAAARAGATYVDVEDDALAAFGRVAAPTKLVVSRHDFDALPTHAPALIERLVATGADVVKFAARLRGCLDLLSLSRAVARAGRPVVAIGLGPAGLPTRYSSERFQSPWLYTRYDGGDVSEAVLAAPAELPSFKTATELWRVAPFGPPPEVAYAVVGDRADESIGPEAWNRLFLKRGIRARYLPIVTESLTGIRETCKLLGVRALSVTTPFKTAILAEADDVHPRAAEIGAANTFVNEGGAWTAYDADSDGASIPIKRAFADDRAALSGGRAYVYGLGGAGRAAAWALRALGCRTTLVARRRELVGTTPLGSTIPVVHLDDVPDGGAAILVNATPCGSSRDPNGVAIDLRRAAQDALVFETNYRPLETPLVAAARRAGLRVLTGDAFYVAQALSQLRLVRTDCDDAAADLEAIVAATLSGRVG